MLAAGWLWVPWVVQQGQDSLALSRGICTKKHPAHPPCFKVTVGNLRKLGNPSCFGQQTFPVCCRCVTDSTLADVLGEQGGQGGVFPFPKGHWSLAEPPQAPCRCGAAPEAPQGVSYLGGRGAVWALGSAGIGVRGQQQCQAEDDHESGRAHGCLGEHRAGQTDRQTLRAPAAPLAGHRMCPGPDLHRCHKRCLLRPMPREEPRVWHRSRPRVGLILASVGRSGLLVMQLPHLKL